MFGSIIRSVVLAGAISISVLSPAFADTGTGTPPSGSRGAPVKTVTLCSDVNYGGVCQWWTESVPNLIGSAVGNDSASSIKNVRPNTAVYLFSDINYQGTCQVFTGDVSSLFGTVIGNDRVSSFKIGDASWDGIRSSAAPCPSKPIETRWYTQSSAVINHWDTSRRTFSCPADYPYVGDLANPVGVPFRNLSSANVTAALAGGGYGSRSIDVTFGNPNLFGDQTTNVSLACHNDS